MALLAYVIGLPASGKSTLIEAVSRELGWAAVYDDAHDPDGALLARFVAMENALMPGVSLHERRRRAKRRGQPWPEGFVTLSTPALIDAMAKAEGERLMPEIDRALATSPGAFVEGYNLVSKGLPEPDVLVECTAPAEVRRQRLMQRGHRGEELEFFVTRPHFGRFERHRPPDLIHESDRPLDAVAFAESVRAVAVARVGGAA